MELTGKQKRFLRALGVNMDPILTVGKDGVSGNTIAQADGALLARELIKGRILQTAPESVEDSATTIAEATGAELVQVVGRNFLLYRPNPEKPVIELP
ncbi:MAG TPA: ribosome assembly RNA-binding protein YhbY [Symbiobacteriaceae bacterium]|nr:ribosome assembly RNA-binding protein YhbY [Symbiobacteriaceae bacterium]